ncbi:MAG: hypothetical protein KBC94_08600 [Pseudacidovorax sp.]|uniref:DUF6156 family protein n=1 Tax=Pseudacidovorax sp. TaxID=1934311 RepID=UPI001B78C6A9|nr:DUF6156 family protein [Pseudacidovorax sp.]MBP6894469.1 hypothetical protein [Pseudacidovorax sp.]
MNESAQSGLRYFSSYSGRGLPLRLVGELPPEAIAHRNTCFRASYDEAGRPLCIEKLVYGAVEMRYDYRWAADGALAGVTVSEEGEAPRELVLG